jgi:hypothetical protein
MFNIRLISLLTFACVTLSSVYSESIEEMPLEAYQSLQLPDMQGPLRYENDHELARMLVEQTQAQLDDFERLFEEYERFCELEEQFMQKSKDPRLAKRLMASALVLDEIMQKRHLQGLFSSQLSEQILLFSQMARKQQSQTTLPLQVETP